MRALFLALMLLATPAVGATDATVADLVAKLSARALPAPVHAAPTSLDATDVGYGVRTENYPCYVATIVNVFAVSFDGVARDAIVFDEPLVIAPEPDIPCGPGQRSFLGEQGLTIAPEPYDWVACTAFEGPFGGWASIASSCHVADFTHATLRGRIGFTDLRDCAGDICVTLQQVFAGTNNAPGFTDAGVIAVAK